MIHLLIELREKLAEYFGSDAPVFMETIRDPETGSKQLGIFVGVHLSPEDAFAVLNKFDKGWWIEAEQRVRGKMLILVDVRFLDG